VFAARHSACRAGNQQARPRRLRPRGVRAHCRGIPPDSGRAWFCLARGAPDLGARGRQCHRTLAEHAVVRGPEPPRISRNGGSRGWHGRPAVPLSGAVDQPPGSGFPRFRRDRRGGLGRAGRPGRGDGLRPPVADQGDCDLRRPAEAGRDRRRGDIDPGRRDRHLARRPAGGATGARRVRRPVRRHPGVDEGGEPDTGPLLLAEARNPHCGGDGDGPQIPHRCR
jgi:hypothetical protein